MEFLLSVLIAIIFSLVSSPTDQSQSAIPSLPKSIPQIKGVHASVSASLASPSAKPKATSSAKKKVAPNPLPSEKPAQKSKAILILEALNNYRNKKGVGSLNWDSKLGDLASKRVQTFLSLGKSDHHEGFKPYLTPDGFNSLGFSSLGENSSTGFKGSEQDLIEKFYASHAPHDQNQLDSKWTHVGISASGEFTDLVFGGK